MKKSTLAKIGVAALAFSCLTGFGLKDLKPDLDKCKGKKKDKKCKMEEVGKAVVIAVAAKIIYDMVIDYQSRQVADEKQVSDEYLKGRGSLPEEPQVVQYQSSLKPGTVVKVGKATKVVSQLEVVPSKHSNVVDIQEKIEIYDNEETDKVIKSLVKTVNEKTKKAGSFKNEFNFTLPEGMPQGVYKIKTAVILNGKELEDTSNDMQVVIHVMPNNQYQLLALVQ